MTRFAFSRGFGNKSVAACLLTVVSFVGCETRPEPASPALAQTPQVPQEQPGGQPRNSPATDLPEKHRFIDRGEFWDVIYLGDAKAGYSKTSVLPLLGIDPPLIRIESVLHLQVSRFGETSEQQVRTSSIETPGGALVRFESDGPPSGISSGVAQGDTLIIRSPNKPAIKLPWTAEFKGFFGTEESLEEQPLLPGQKRTIKQLVPGFNRVADVELSASDYERTDTSIGPQKLLRIEQTVRFAEAEAKPMECTIWTDEQGKTLKMQTGSMKTYRTTPENALAPAKGAKLDLGRDVLVKIDPPLKNAAATTEVVYRVSLVDGDPAKIFASGPTQTVKPLGPHAAEITVRSLRARGDDVSAGGDQPSDADRQPNEQIQSNDPLVVALAQKVAPDVKDPRQLAFALEKFVNGYITEKDYSQAFSSAAEVAKTKRGDCTEHAVLLAALARRGIPSRVAAGLVYCVDAKSGQGFAYHMWTEVYVDHFWLPLDATRAQAGVAADHIELSHTNLAGAAALTNLVPVVQLIGQLKIEVLKVAVQKVTVE